MPTAPRLSGATSSSTETARSALQPDPQRHGVTTGPCHPLGHRRRRFAPHRPDGRCHLGWPDPDRDVEPVEEGGRQPAGVALAGGGAAPALTRGTTFAARARVHGPHQDEPGRKGGRAPGPADPDQAFFQGLPEGVEHDRRELTHLVQEQHASMGQADLPGTHPGRSRLRSWPPATRRGGGPGTAAAPSARRGAGSARPPNGSASPPAPSTGSSVGNRPGSRVASIVFPDPGGPTNSRWCPPAAATSRARLANRWPWTSARSGLGSRCSPELVGHAVGRPGPRCAGPGHRGSGQ